MSIVQYNVSVIVDGAVPIEGSVCALLGMLFGGVRATSAYDGEGLDACMLATWVRNPPLGRLGGLCFIHTP